MTEKTVSRKIIYEGRVLTLRVDDIILPDGKPATREVCDHPGGVAVLPLFDNGDVATVRQFRYPYMETLVEIPAGKLERGSGERPEDCALRELREETGLVPDELRELGCLYPSPGYLNETLYLFLATGLRQERQALDEDEFLVVERVNFSVLRKMIADGDIRDAKTVAAVFKTAMLLGI